jgi:hypothetical protein
MHFGIKPIPKTLNWNLSNYRRENLLSLLEQGKDDGYTKPIQRPIFDNLYAFKYKWDPAKYKNAKYEKFLESMKEHPDVQDPYKLDMDDFAKAISLVSEDFKENVLEYENSKFGQMQSEIFNDLELL